MTTDVSTPVSPPPFSSVSGSMVSPVVLSPVSAPVSVHASASFPPPPSLPPSSGYVPQFLVFSGMLSPENGLFSGVAAFSSQPASCLPWSTTMPTTAHLSAVQPRFAVGVFGSSQLPQTGPVLYGPPPPTLDTSWLSLGLSLPHIHPSIFSINIKNFITIVLTTVENFLSWRTQFVAFLVTQQLNGFFDGTLDTPSFYILDFNGVQHPNPSYSVWLRLDQLVRSWLFAMISPKLLTGVHDLIHAKQIWDCLSHRFNTASLARAMYLLRTVSNLPKDPKQSMEDYLRGIKHIATPVPDLELVQLTLNGLDEDYYNLVTTLAYGTTFLTFDDLRSKLIHYGQHLRFLKSKESFQRIDEGFQNVALIVGVTSIFGNSLVDILTLSDTPGGHWKVYGIACRPQPERQFHHHIEYIQCEMADLGDTEAKLSCLTYVTHIFYVGLVSKFGEADNSIENGKMLCNVLTAVTPSAQHFNIFLHSCSRKLSLVVQGYPEAADAAIVEDFGRAIPTGVCRIQRRIRYPRGNDERKGHHLGQEHRVRTPADKAGGGWDMGASGFSSQQTVTKKGTCKHCGKYDHEENGCYELIGYPTRWGIRGKGRGRGRGSRGGRTESSRGRGTGAQSAYVVATNRATEQVPVPNHGEGDCPTLPGFTNE
ncbi:hypothetical protein Cgig2_028266 [Carnegiea gigantea]|uniref:Uncharacterized protein n=1 Tax=Carnegiea gigantea TaxID=171969 RepID=A0A9Q1GRF1_9CARY|nr:hypothetical protein Cgig2_028266 [Carnegiea gigantea]